MTITWRSVMAPGLNPTELMKNAVRTLDSGADGLIDFGGQMRDLNTKGLNDGAKMATEDLIAQMRAKNLNLGQLNQNEAQFTDAAAIRKMIDPRYADRIDPNNVSGAFSELQSKYRDTLYNEAAAAGKAEAERTGSVAAGAALTEKMMREGGMKENILSKRSGDFMNNDVAVLKAQISEDTGVNTNAFLGNIDLTKLNADSMPGVLKQAQDLYGKKVDLDKVRSFVNEQLKLSNSDKNSKLQRQLLTAQLKAAQAKPNQFKVDRDMKTGTILYYDANGNSVEGRTRKGFEMKAKEVLADMNIKRGDDWIPFNELGEEAQKTEMNKLIVQWTNEQNQRFRETMGTGFTGKDLSMEDLNPQNLVDKFLDEKGEPTMKPLADAITPKTRTVTPETIQANLAKGNQGGDWVQQQYGTANQGPGLVDTFANWFKETQSKAHTTAEERNKKVVALIKLKSDGKITAAEYAKRLQALTEAGGNY